MMSHAVGSRKAFPQPVQIHRPEGAIVEAVARPPLLAPDHAAVVRSHRSGEPGVTERGQHAAHVDVPELARVRYFMKRAPAHALHVPAMREVDPAVRAEGP